MSVPHAAALLLLHGASGTLRASVCDGSPTSPRAWQRLPANRASCGEPVRTPKRTGPESRPDLRRSLLCPPLCSFSSTCCSGMWPSAARVPQLCLPPDFPAFNGAALQAGTGPEGFLFLSLRFSPPPLICSALPGGPPSAVGSDPYYGRGEKGRTRTPPECRKRFLELP